MAPQSDVPHKACLKLGYLALLAMLTWLGGSSTVVAQADGVYYTRQTVFLIPFQTESAEKRIRQVLLHTSEDFGKTYQQVGSAGPAEKNFRFQAQHDGWYWFAVQTQDIDGKLHPTSPQGMQAGLKVCVDTAAPQIALRASTNRDQAAGVDWEIRDENPELLSLRLDYRPSGGQEWYPLTAQQMLVGRHSWTPTVNGPLEVRLQIRDKAGNPGEAVTTLTPEGGASPSSDLRPRGGNKVIMVNKRRINLNFKIDNVGKSDVANVEVWVTQDTRSWQKYGNAPKNPPFVLDLSGEGRYGFSLVAISGVGLSERRPQAGDEPQVWVEVDETKPVVRLVTVVVGQGIDAGKMTIKWVATDTFLEERPVTLSYATTPSGPWTPIVKNLANEGIYIWQMPSDGLPFQFHVRVEAADQAGNIGSDESGQPVAVDLSVPKVSVIGIEPAAALR